MRRKQDWQRSTVVAWLPAAVWAAFIFVLSSIPGTKFPAVKLPNADKLVHMFVYAVLGALIFRAVTATAPATTTTTTPTPTPTTLSATERARPDMTNVLLAAALTTLYGISDEIHQLWTPHRSADWHDVVADAVGGLSGAFALAALRWLKIRR